MLKNRWRQMQLWQRDDIARVILSLSVVLG